MENKIDFLLKLDNVQKHNRILALKNKMENDKEIAEELFLSYKELIDKKDKEIAQLKERANILKNENILLNKQVKKYENKVPQIIKKIFGI